MIERAGGTVAEPEERTVSCQAIGLEGEDHTLYAVLGPGAYLPAAVVENFRSKNPRPVEELQPMWVSTRIFS